MSRSPKDASQEEEDDYMNMVIQEPDRKESQLKRIQREKRDRIERSQRTKKTKEQREEETEEAMRKPIDSSNKGFQMLAKMGFDPSTKPSAQPIVVERRGREGIGIETDKKRKAREAFDEHAKKAKVEKETVEDYTARIMQERKDKRADGQFVGAQRVAEKLDMDAEDQAAAADAEEQGDDTTKKPAFTIEGTSKPLKSIPVFWRGLVRGRLEHDSEARMRKHLLSTDSSRLPTFDDSDLDPDDKQALERKDKTELVVHEDLAEEDTELEEFMALPPSERLEKVVMYLREQHKYCFWCKYQYPDKDMEGCPGVTEEDHD
ncbi:putative G-patch domain protein [Phyllosticta capitalensis]|uniref:G-patch domain protein n=1 Tax=Phyllosticta capitalensis TaxID=121624 RepID=A0ABR1YEX9_9PEZI